MNPHDPRPWIDARLRDELQELLDELDHQGIIPASGVVPTHEQYLAIPGARGEVAEALLRVERLSRLLP